jgi:hypothetical protein
MALPAAQVTLSWTDNANNEAGFRVERATGSGAFVEINGSIAANATTYLDATAAAGATYSYRVRAFNTAGDSAYSNTATITLPPLGTPPSAPNGVTLEIPGTLVNVSNRGTITVGDATMIPGFVISGGPLKVLIRVVGPTIGSAPFNVPGTCADPRLSLRNSAGAEIATNDNWLPSDAAAMAQVGAFALPAGSKDAALVITLPPGNYTVITTGVAGATGVALAEVYALP